jgi:hypothetical protein
MIHDDAAESSGARDRGSESDRRRGACALPNACAWDTSARTSRAVADAVVALALGQAGFELENALNEVAAVEELIGALVEQAAPGASRGAERAEGR